MPAVHRGAAAWPQPKPAANLSPSCRPLDPPPRRPQFIEARLDKTTAELAHGCDAACIFVNDACDAEARGGRGWGRYGGWGRRGRLAAEGAACPGLRLWPPRRRAARYPAGGASAVLTYTCDPTPCPSHPYLHVASPPAGGERAGRLRRALHRAALRRLRPGGLRLLRRAAPAVLHWSGRKAHSRRRRAPLHEHLCTRPPARPPARPPTLLCPAPQVDLAACAARGLRVVRVPTYSPRTVAEHAFALAFGLARCARVRWLCVCTRMAAGCVHTRGCWLCAHAWLLAVCTRVAAFAGRALCG